MNMNKKLDKYLISKTAAYWHYYHLKRDPDFKKEASKLVEQIAICVSDKSPFLPMCIEDYDLVQDPKKGYKLERIKSFQVRWGIKSSYTLLNFLLHGDENNLPQTNFNYVLGYDDETGTFTLQLPGTVQIEDMDRVWLSIQEWKKYIGFDTKKKQEDTRRKSAIAYEMWKMQREGATWTMITKAIDDRFGTEYKDNIRDAKDFYNSHGYFHQVG